MSVLTWPREHRATTESQFYLQSSNLMAISGLTGQQTPYGPQYQRFVAKLTFPGKKGPEWRQLQGLITRLRGAGGKIRLVDYHRMFNAYDTAVRAANGATSRWSDDSLWSDGSGWANGYLPPSVAVDEPASRGDDSVVLRGLPASLADALSAADLIEFRPNAIAPEYGMLHEVVNAARTNSDGKTRVYFQAPLHANLAAGDMAVLRYPMSVFRLAADTEGVIQRSLGNVGNLGLSFIEVLP